MQGLQYIWLVRSSTSTIMTRLGSGASYTMVAGLSIIGKASLLGISGTRGRASSLWSPECGQVTTGLGSSGMVREDGLRTAPFTCNAVEGILISNRLLKDCYNDVDGPIRYQGTMFYYIY